MVQCLHEFREVVLLVQTLRKKGLTNHNIFRAKRKGVSPGFALPEFSNTLADLCIDLESDSILSSDESLGAYIEADFEFPPETHEYLMDLVPAPEFITVTSKKLSPISLNTLNQNKIDPNLYKSQKLVGHFFPRKNYVLHSNLLITYAKLGVKITKIRKVLKFVQAPVLKDWIEHCISKRLQAVKNNDIFGKNFFKLVINATFGKLIENLLKRMDCKLACTQANMLKLMSNPLFQSCRMINSELLAVISKPKSVVMSRPTIMGVTILALAKDYMYNYFYNTLKKTWVNRVSLMYTDTDSFIVSLKTPNLTKDLINIKDSLDTSNFHPEHPLHSISNMGSLFKFKIENSAHRIVAFCGLASKSYAVIIVADSDQLTYEKQKSIVTDFKINEIGQGLLIRGKGIHKTVLNKLNFENYLSALRSDVSERCIFTQMSSKKHVIHITKSVKTSINPLCSKRYLKKCKIHSVPFGYYNKSSNCACSRSGSKI